MASIGVSFINIKTLSASVKKLQRLMS